MTKVNFLQMSDKEQKNYMNTANYITELIEDAYNAITEKELTHGVNVVFQNDDESITIVIALKNDRTTKIKLISDVVTIEELKDNDNWQFGLIEAMDTIDIIEIEALDA